MGKIERETKNGLKIWYLNDFLVKNARNTHK